MVQWSMHETDAIRNGDDRHMCCHLHITRGIWFHSSNANRNGEIYHVLTPYCFAGQWFHGL